jgi:hypothetical protein
MLSIMRGAVTSVATPNKELLKTLKLLRLLLLFLPLFNILKEARFDKRVISYYLSFKK